MARERKRSAFTARDPGFAAKLEMAPAGPVPQDGAAPPPAAPAPGDRATIDEAGRSPASEAAAVRTSRSAAPEQGSPTSPLLPAANAEQQAFQPAGKGKEMVAIRITFSWPSTVIARASVMAQVARCPVGTLMQRIWSGARASLAAGLEAGLDHAAIPSARAAGAAGRLDSRLLISQAAHARLQAEIDPCGLVGLSSPLSRWARDQMISHAEQYLTRAGY
ncbi:hypothetical protein [Paracoccus yeei]|jgi:hypothetical protein|uniref:hypothetical protein n=1 Tax=Paracoccus yeei TaxID=147645 RepID=UPI003BF7AE05